MEPKITASGTTLTIVVDLSGPGAPSASGKTLVLASTRGNRKVKTDVGEVMVGLNVFKKGAE